MNEPTTKALTLYGVVDAHDRLLPSPAHDSIIQLYTSPDAAGARLSSSGHRVAMVCAVVLSPQVLPPARTDPQPPPPPAPLEGQQPPQGQQAVPRRRAKPAKKAKPKPAAKEGG